MTEAHDIKRHIMPLPKYLSIIIIGPHKILFLCVCVGFGHFCQCFNSLSISKGGVYIFFFNQTKDLQRQLQLQNARRLRKVGYQSLYITLPKIGCNIFNNCNLHTAIFLILQPAHCNIFNIRACLFRAFNYITPDNFPANKKDHLRFP